MMIRKIILSFIFISVISLFIYYFFTDNYIYLEKIKTNSTYLFVTAFFSFSRKKHTNNDYIGWMNNYFRVIKSSVLIFSDVESVKLVPYNRSNCIILKSIYDLLCIKKYEKWYKNQNSIDPERNKVNHSMELYMVWNAKICLLKMATELYNASVYIWIDIGSFRKEYTYTIFPNTYVIDYLSKLNSMFFFVVNKKFIRKSIKPLLIRGDFIEGGSFGGSKNCIKEYNNIFWKVHDYYLKRGEFVGKDQTLYNTIAIYYFKDIVLFPMYGYFRCWNNKWFRYINLYGGEGCALLKEKNISSYLF